MADKDEKKDLPKSDDDTTSKLESKPADDDKKLDDLPEEESKDEGTTEPSDTSTDDQNLEQVDADSIIEAFMEANPELAELDVEEWPEDAIEMLRDTFNTENIDAPNGTLPEDEDAEGAPVAPIEEAAVEVEAPLIEEESDPDLDELSHLVEAGDKDGAWNKLQSILGVSPQEEPVPTNALDRIMSSKNHLAKHISGLRF
jgi:hypothetical protein